MTDALAAFAHAAQAYFEAVSDLPIDGRGPVAEFEARIARAAARALASNEAIRPGDAETTAEKGARARTITTLTTQVRRWGWPDLSGDDAEARIQARLAAHDHRYRTPVLQAARAWRTGPQDWCPDRVADAFADEAIRRGLAPAPTDPGEAEAAYPGLLREFLTAPALGQDPPTMTPDEHFTLAEAVDQLRRHADPSTPAVQALRDLRAEFADAAKRDGSLRTILVGADLTLHHRFSCIAGYRTNPAHPLGRHGESCIADGNTAIGCNSLRHYFYGTGGFLSYLRLAASAGRCLRDFPPEARGLPAGSADPGIPVRAEHDNSESSEMGLWTLTLHRLAWRTRFATPLTAPPRILTWNGMTAYDPASNPEAAEAEARDFLQRIDAGGFRGAWPMPPDRVLVSELRDNVFLSSVRAIDLILAGTIPTAPAVAALDFAIGPVPAAFGDTSPVGPLPVDAVASSGRAVPSDAMKPGAKALAAAYQLQKAGRPVSLKAACALARVDRKNVQRRYPEVVDTIKALAAPDRSPRRGTRDRRTGVIDAIDRAEGSPSNPTNRPQEKN